MRDEWGRVFGIAALVIAAIVVLAVTCARGQDARKIDCPPEAKSCKVLIVTPEQEESLKLLISNTGVSGPYNQIKGAIDFWLDYIAKAPAGQVAGRPTVADPPKPR